MIAQTPWQKLLELLDECWKI